MIPWFLPLAASVASAAVVQRPGLQLPASAPIHQAAVKDMFVTSYQAYQYVPVVFISTSTHRAACRTYAWGHDDLLPISQSFSDGRNGWGASIADVMATMVGNGSLNGLKFSSLRFFRRVM